MAPDPLSPLGCEADHGAGERGCITCGDVAVPLRVLKVDEARELALCENEAGERESVEIALVAPVAPGDQVLVHAGTAIGPAQLDRSREAGGRELPSERDPGWIAEVTR